MQGNSLFVFVKILRFLNLWQVPQNILRSFTNRNCSFYIFGSLCQILTMRKDICKLLTQNKQKMNVLILQFLNCFSVFFIYTENSSSFQGLWVDFEPPRASCTVHIHTDNIGQNRTVNQMKNLLLLKYKCLGIHIVLQFNRNSLSFKSSQYLCGVFKNRTNFFRSLCITLLINDEQRF